MNAGDPVGPSSTRGPQVRAGQGLPLLDRQPELALLGATLDTALQAAAPYAVLVSAPPGAGKTRLLDELRSRVDERWPKLAVISARADVLGGGRPYGLVGDALRQFAGRAGSNSSAFRKWALAELGSESSPVVADFLGELVGRLNPKPSREWLAARQDPMLISDRLRGAFAAWIDRRLARGPMLMLVDDLHWGDGPSLQLLDAALARRDSGAFVVVAVTRPELSARFPELWRRRSLTELRLSPLSTRSAERLVSTLAPDLNASRSARIVARGKGNPLFLQTLCLRSGDDAEPLPGSILEAVQSSLTSLPSESRRLLRAASVFGSVFWAEGLSLIVGQDTQLQTDLARLCNTGYLRELSQQDHAGVGAWAFAHDLFRVAADSFWSEADRRDAHRLAADWLESQPWTRPVVMAQHRRCAGQVGATVHWFERAAHQALSRCDFAATLGLVDRAIDAGAIGESRGRLRLLQAEAHHGLDDPEAAGRCARAALSELPTGSMVWFNAAQRQIVATGRGGEVSELLVQAETLIVAEVGGEEAEVARGMALVAAALQLLYRDQLEMAQPLIDAARALIRGLGSDQPLLQARLHKLNGVAAGYEGALEPALASFEAALGVYEQVGDRRRWAQEASYVADLRIGLGQYAAVRDSMLAIREAAAPLGLSRVVALADLREGVALTRLNELQTGREAICRAMDALAGLGDARAWIGARVSLAENLLMSGATVAAEHELEAVLDATQQDPSLRARAQILLARLRLVTGNPEFALQPLDGALAELDRSGHVEGSTAALRLAWAEALGETGDRYGARAAIREALEVVMQTASSIQGEELRASFLERVSEHRRIRELARQWGISD